jgi:hypothetical protein
MMMNTTQELADTIGRHAVEVSQRERELAAADRLIVSLRGLQAL